jgi:hypothetical protein
MLGDAEIFILTLLSVSGALFSAIVGWLDSGESFETRKFTSSILRAFLAGIVTAGATFVGLDTIANGWVYVFAFLGGAGIDVLGNRISGAITAQPKTEVKAT